MSAAPAAAALQDEPVGALPDAPPAAKPLSLPDGADRAAAQLDAGSLTLPRGDVIGFDESDRGLSAGVAAGPGGNGTTVLARTRPDYDPVPYKLGSFRFTPELTAAAGYDSNVFVQRTARGDAFGNLRASGVLASDWGRNALDLTSEINERAYSKYDTESGITYRTRLRGLLEATRALQITGEADREHDFVERGGTGEILRTRRPVRYDLSYGQLAVADELGRLRTKLAGYVGDYDYHNAHAPDGRPLDQQYRDYKLYRVQGELDYVPGAGPVFFVSATGEFRRFRVPSKPILRDSDGLELLGGVSSDITRLIRGRLALGYIYANFKDPRVSSRAAISFDADIDYLATEITTVKLTARRYFQNVSAPTSPAALATDVTLGVDHELLRNLILSASVSYRTSHYIFIAQQSTSYGADAGARWLINRKLHADFGVKYGTRHGASELANSSIGSTFNQVRTSIGLTYTP